MDLSNDLAYLKQHQDNLREAAEAHRLVKAMHKSKRSRLPKLLGHLGRRKISRETWEQNRMILQTQTEST